MAERSLRFDLIGRDKSFSKTLDAAGRKGQKLNREFSRVMGGAGDTAGRKFSTRFHQRLGGGFSVATGLATRAAGLIGGAFAAIKIGQFLKGAIDEAREAAKVHRITAARIKSTGGAANVTAKDIDRLTGSLMRQVAVDDDVIQSGTNILLTFNKVRNETGKGNDIFNRATKAAVDLAAGLNQGQVSAEGLQGANLQLGKALQDPIKGITALRRAGVSFTAAQREQITTLVESGDQLGAMKIILKAVEEQFGGTAKAAVDPWQRVKVIFDEVKEKIGTALLPALKKVADWLAVTIPAAFDATTAKLKIAREWWDKNKESIGALGDALNVIFVPAAKNAEKGNEDLRTSAQKLTDTLDSGLEVALQITKGFQYLGIAAGETSEAIINAGIFILRTWAFTIAATGRVINIFDRLSGGTGHAADSMMHSLDGVIDSMRDLRTDTEKQTAKVRESIRNTQAAIDRLHGKDIKITAHPTFSFSKSFTRVDWLSARLAAGRMAKGGQVPGGYGGGDRVPILAEPGEAVVDKVRTRRYADLLAMMGVPGFAKGGLLERIGQTGGAHTGVANLMGGWTKRLLDKALAKLLAGNPAIRAFIRSVDPLPYIWGAAGPGGYDCSGLVSAVYGKHTRKGGGQGQRYFTTATIGTGTPGLRSGLGGMFQIGVTPGRGHMAGRYAGLGFEAESTRTGIKIGGAASRPESFARRFHMARGGLVNDRLLRMFDVGGDAGKLRINGRVFDSGGWLPPHSATLAINRTSRHEPVGRAGTTVNVTVNVHGMVATNVRQAARELAPAIADQLRSIQRRGYATVVP